MPAKPITLGHVEAHEKLTARLFVQPTGESGYIDCGNVLDFKFAPERQFRTRMRAEGGVRIVSDEEVDTIHDRWEFTLDERDSFNEKLIGLATAAAAATTAAVTAPSGTATLTDVVKGRSYFVGKTGLDTFVLKKASTTLVAGTDYTVDLNTGRVTILTGSVTVTDGDDLDATFGNAERVNTTYTAQNTFRFEGDIRIEEFNQHNKEPLRITSFSGVLMATAYPEHTGEFAKFTVRATPITPPTVLKRHSLK